MTCPRVATTPEVLFRIPSGPLSTLLTACRDGQPPRSRCDPRVWLCVEFCCCMQSLERSLIWLFVTVAFVRLWHVLAGIYLLVFPPSFAYDAVGSNIFCLDGSSSLRLTMNGRSIEANFLAGGRYGSVLIGSSLWLPRPHWRLELICLFNRFTPSRA